MILIAAPTADPASGGNAFRANLNAWQFLLSPLAFFVRALLVGNRSLGNWISNLVPTHESVNCFYD